MRGYRNNPRIRNENELVSYKREREREKQNLKTFFR